MRLQNREHRFPLTRLHRKRTPCSQAYPYVKQPEHVYSIDHFTLQMKLESTDAPTKVLTESYKRQCR